MDAVELEQLEQLQQRRRTIATRWCEGATSPEIGEELGISKGAVNGEIFALRRGGMPLANRRPGGPPRRRRGQLPLQGGQA